MIEAAPNFESKSKESKSATYEIKDHEGRVRCNVKLEYEILPSEEDGGVDRRRITFFILESGENSIDVFKLVDVFPKGGVFIATEAGENWYDPETEEISVPEPNTLLNLYIGLHELGHASQFTEKIYREVNDVSTKNHGSAIAQFQVISNWFDNKNRVIPIPKDVVESLNSISSDYLKIKQWQKEENIYDSKRMAEAVCENIVNGFSASFPVNIRNRAEEIYWDESNKNRSHGWFFLYECLKVALRENNLLTQEKELEMEAALHQAREVFDNIYQLVYKSNIQLSDLWDNFEAISAPYPEWIDTMATISGNAIMERDADYRAFTWIREMQTKLKTSLTFPVKISSDELTVVLGEVLKGNNIEDVKLDTENVRLQSALKQLQTYCKQDKISVRKIMNAALTSHGANARDVRSLFKRRTFR